MTNLFSRVVGLFIAGFICITPAFCSDGTDSRAVAVTTAFLENVGQLTDQHGKARTNIQFTAHLDGMDVFIGSGSIAYQWHKKEYTDSGATSANSAGNSNPVYTAYRLDVLLQGANKHAEVLKSNGQPYFERYYLPQVEEQGAIAHTFGTLTYKNVYPGIDWVLYVNAGKLKYDFVVHPGADASLIKLNYAGADRLELDKGSITAYTPFGSVNEAPPVAYAKETGKTVPCQFILSGHTVSFKHGSYNGTLVIDPAVAWATYFGKNNHDASYASIVEQSGNVYMTGNSSNLKIITSNAHQSTFGGSGGIGGGDAILVKFDNNGFPVWSTYYGGSRYDAGHALAFDLAKQHVYLGGSTASSNNIASPGAHQEVYGGFNEDGFLAKFDTAGKRIWGTYYGGTADDEVYHITCDAADNVYITGKTSSRDSIATPGSYLDSKSTSDDDGMLVKFTPSGTRVWGTYYGGSNDDGGSGIVFDAHNMLYMTMNTQSAGLGTTGKHQATIGGGVDILLSKFDTTGMPLWATYYGGAQDEGGHAVFDREKRYLYLAGMSKSNTGIATAGSFQPANAGGSDAILVKFDTTGTRLWGTYYGGTGDDYGSVAFDYAGNIYLSGTTRSLTGMATPGAIRTMHKGGVDVFISRFSSGGQLLYSTYYGGTGDDYLSSIGFDAQSNIYFSGQTLSSADLSTPGSYQPVYGGGVDAYMVKFWADTTLKLAAEPTVICNGSNVGIRYAATGNFSSSNVFTAELSDASGSFANPVVLGTINSTTSDTIPGTLPTAGNFRLRVVSDAPVLISDTIDLLPVVTSSGSNSPLCQGNTLMLNAAGTAGSTYHWAGPNNFTGNMQNPSIPSVGQAGNGDYSITVKKYGCSSVPDTVKVIVNSLPLPVITVTNFVQLSTGVFSSYQWYVDGQPINGAIAATHLATQNGNYTVEVTDANGCTNTSQGAVISNVSVHDMEYTGSGIKIYPNPANEIITIDGAQGKSYQVLDIAGRTLKKGTIDNTSVNIAGLPAGHYIIRITDEHNTVSGKFYKE